MLSGFNVSIGEKLINAAVKFILWLTQSLRTIHRHSPITENFNEMVSLTYKFTQIDYKNQERHVVVLLRKDIYLRRFSSDIMLPNPAMMPIGARRDLSLACVAGEISSLMIKSMAPAAAPS